MTMIKLPKSKNTRDVVRFNNFAAEIHDYSRGRGGNLNFQIAQAGIVMIITLFNVAVSFRWENLS